MGKQRQRAGFGTAPCVGANIVKQQVNQSRFQLPVTALCGRFDGGAQLVRRHGSDEFLLMGQQLPQLVEAGAVGVEIGAHYENNGRSPRLTGCGGEAAYKGFLFRFTAAEREELFKLVYDQERVGGDGRFCHALQRLAKPFRTCSQLIHKAAR